jgi:hypothetical protein
MTVQQAVKTGAGFADRARSRRSVRIVDHAETIHLNALSALRK